MITVLIFRDSQHYADYYYTLKYSDYESRCKKVVERPLIFELDILNIDFDMYCQIVLDNYGLTVDCPFCFWHSPAVAYLRPKIERRVVNKKEIIEVEENTIKCPHLLYDIDHVSKRENQDYYKNLLINWKEWKLKIPKTKLEE